MAQIQQKNNSTVTPEDFDPFDAATRFDRLWAGWEKVRDNAGAVGGDGVSVGEFHADAPNRVSRLSHALRKGSYRVGDSRRVAIPKKSGGFRTLTIPSVVDRVAQASVALTLGPALDRLMEPSSFAYRPGRSVAQAISRIASLRRDGYRFVVDGDIRAYFDNIPHEPLIDLLDRVVSSPRLVDLIALWLESYAETGRGVPQGSPLSPLLANLYLDHVDEAIEDRGVRLVRYADDFVILCREEGQAASALQKMAELLAAAGLELNLEKTAIRTFDQGFRFLGHVMVKSMVWKEMSVDETPGEDLVGTAERVLTLAAEQRPAELMAEAEKAFPRGRWSPRQRVMYVTGAGRRLEAKGEHFLVKDGDNLLIQLPTASVDRIEMLGGTEVDMDALDLAAQSDTEIVRIDGRGLTIGRWQGPEPARAALQLKQAAVILDPTRRSTLARAIVGGKIANQRALLKRLDRTRNLPDMQKASVTLGRLVRRMDKGDEGVAEAMGREGEAAALYWPLLADMLALPWAFSGKRRRRVGFDPFNAAVDLLSSMLLRECRAALQHAGLNTGFSVLHEPEDRQDGLAFDLAEEFRAPLVEATVFALFKRRALRQETFQDTPNGWRLTRDGFEATIRGYEQALSRPVRDPQGGEDYLWRGIIDLQANRLADAFETGAAYRSYRMDF